MRWRCDYKAVVVFGILGARAFAQDTLIYVTETPPGPCAGGPTDGIRRFVEIGPGGALVELPESPWPGSSPVSGTGVLLLPSVGMGDGLFGERGSGSPCPPNPAQSAHRFDVGPTLSPEGPPAQPALPFAFVTVNQMARDDATGQVFAANWSPSPGGTPPAPNPGTVEVFDYDPQTDAFTHCGTLTMPAGTVPEEDGSALGVAVDPASGDLYVAGYHVIRRFIRTSACSYAFQAYVYQQPGSLQPFANYLIHGLAIRGGKLYAAQLNNESPPKNSTILVFDLTQSFSQTAIPLSHPGAISCAFSPGGQEMFVSYHLGARLTRMVESSPGVWVEVEDLPDPATPGYGYVSVAPADNGAFSTYGAGCGSQRPAALTGFGEACSPPPPPPQPRPRPSELLIVAASSIPNPPMPVMLLWASKAQANLPLGGACTLLVDPAMSSFLVLPIDADGTFKVEIDVMASSCPATPVYLQAFFPDPGLPTGLSASNGLRYN